MKYIQKNSPPADFVAYRKTPGATYARLRRKKKLYNLVKLSLLQEQGFVCCYCGRRICLGGDTQIEHIFAKGTPAYEEMQLDYETNLVACCDGGKKERSSGTIRQCDLYCEACKFQAVLPVHPLMVNCEEKFLYSDDGEMLGVYKDAEVTIKILNLNSPVIKNMRKYAIDNYALYPPISWEEELKRVQQRNSIGQYEEFYFVLESYIKTYHQGELRHEAI